MIIRRADQVQQDRYPRVPRYALANNELGHASLHVGDLTFLPGSSVPYHYHNEGAEETQIMLEGELECWIDGKCTTVRSGDTVTAPPGIRHAFYNRTEEAARMVTAFPLTPPETMHVDVPDLECVSEHRSVIRAGTRRDPYLPGLRGVTRIELSGDFSGAQWTYTYILEIGSGAVVPTVSYSHEVAMFVVQGSLHAILGSEGGAELDMNDAAVVEPGGSIELSNKNVGLARLVVVHPVLNTALI